MYIALGSNESSYHRTRTSHSLELLQTSLVSCVALHSGGTKVLTSTHGQSGVVSSCKNCRVCGTSASNLSATSHGCSSCSCRSTASMREVRCSTGGHSVHARLDALLQYQAAQLWKLQLRAAQAHHIYEINLQLLQCWQRGMQLQLPARKYAQPC